MISRVPRRQNGVSLIEMVIVIALTAILTGLAVAAIAAMYRYDRSTRAQSQQQVAIEQMLLSLRADIHRASSSTWDADKRVLQLDLPNAMVIEYQTRAGRWTRVERSDEGPAATTSFGVSADHRCECDQLQVPAGELLCLRFDIQPSGVSPQQTRTQRNYRYDAVVVVGRDTLLGTTFAVANLESYESNE